jgi:hypothetical protein
VGPGAGALNPASTSLFAVSVFRDGYTSNPLPGAMFAVKRYSANGKPIDLFDTVTTPRLGVCDAAVPDINDGVSMIFERPILNYT